MFPRKRASRFIIRCTTPAIGFVLPVKASAEGFYTFTFRVVPSRLLFRHALKGIIPRYYRGSKSSCDHIGSPRSSRNGKCRSAQLARWRNSLTVLGRADGWSKSRRSCRAFNSALRCSKRRDISLIGQLLQISLEPLQLPPCQIVLAPRRDGAVIGNVGQREAVLPHDWLKIFGHARHRIER